MDTRIDKFTRGFFWAGYVVFLSASIPHIAAYFRHFDPVTPNKWEDAAYWFIAVAIAIVIDVSDVLVSIAVMRAQANGAKFKDVFGFWTFIVFIMLLSWFVNWQYNVVFGTPEFSKVDNYQFGISLVSFSVGQVNPVIGSAFQVLLLVYTSMAHKFAVKPREKSLEELQKEAQEIQQRAGYLATIDAVKQSEKARNRNNILGNLRGWKEGLIETVSVGSNEVDLTAQADAVQEVPADGIYDAGSDDRFEDDFETEEPEFDTDETAAINAGGMVVVEDDFEAETQSETSAEATTSSRSTGKLSVTVKEASLMLGLSETYIRELRTKGKLRSPARNKKLILASTIKAFQDERLKATEKTVREYHHYRQQSTVDNDKLSLAISAVENNLDITDEELAKVLGLSRSHSARFWRLKAEEILTDPQR